MFVKVKNINKQVLKLFYIKKIELFNFTRKRPHGNIRSLQAYNVLTFVKRQHTRI